MKRSFVYRFIGILTALVFPLVMFAQDPPVDPPPPPPPFQGDVPIDGGLSLLVAAGVGYGIKKVRDNRKTNKEADVLSK